MKVRGKTLRFDVSVRKLVDCLREYDAWERKGSRGTAMRNRADKAAGKVEDQAKAWGLDVRDVINAAYRVVYGSTADELFASATA